MRVTHTAEEVQPSIEQIENERRSERKMPISETVKKCAT